MVESRRPDEGGVDADAGAHAEKHVSGVGAQYVHYRHPGLGPRFAYLGEGRTLVDGERMKSPTAMKDAAQEERYAPRPGRLTETAPTGAKAPVPA